MWRHVAELQLARDVCWVQIICLVFICYLARVRVDAFLFIIKLAHQDGAFFCSHLFPDFTCLCRGDVRVPHGIKSESSVSTTDACFQSRQENQHKKALGAPQSKVSSRSFILMNRRKKTKICYYNTSKDRVEKGIGGK